MKRSEPSSRLPLNPVRSDASSNVSAGWIAKLKPETLKDKAGGQLRDLIECLSQQRVPLDKGNFGFMVLLAHGEFEAFVDTFNLLHKLAEAQHPIDQGSYKRTLRLSLPCDWKTTDLAGMLDALSRIQVNILVACASHSAGSDFLLPEAVCHAIAAMLEGGVTDLRIDGIPSHPVAIAQAVRAASCGRSHWEDGRFTRPG
ncbi:hypothetical protein [Hydrogenophaga sp.]|uniref:hypothetical protein n=1 Tax=Hydrogenophaga sp. TaxID=1904254 RepID=UPI002718BD80|nr:hypothetical protein [Hydrogenophaga sp.]MDO9434061.1 hypothetical protein [Hydrogenophaga sp.]